MPDRLRRLHASFADWIGFRTSDNRTVFDGVRYCYDGQAALFQAFSRLRALVDGVVLVPAFHCPTAVEPIIRAGFAVEFYDVDSDLRKPTIAFTELVADRHAIVLVINYFGFPFDLSTLAAIRNRVILVEDCCHSFLHDDGEHLVGERGDLAIYSFKKLLPTYTGGGVRFNNPALRFDAGSPPPVARSLSMLKKVIGDSAQHSDSGVWRGVWKLWSEARGIPPQAEAESGPVAPVSMASAYPFSPDLARAAMPWISRRILHRADLRAVAATRRRNYARLTAAIARHNGLCPVIPSLEAGVVPWGYPVLMADRAHTDYQLRLRGVPLFTFGETLHPAIGTAMDKYPHAQRLSRSLICLALHQQYGADDIGRYCDRINAFFAG